MCLKKKNPVSNPKTRSGDALISKQFFGIGMKYKKAVNAWRLLAALRVFTAISLIIQLFR